MAKVYILEYYEGSSDRTSERYLFISSFGS